MKRGGHGEKQASYTAFTTCKHKLRLSKLPSRSWRLFCMGTYATGTGTKKTHGM